MKIPKDIGDLYQRPMEILKRYKDSEINVIGHTCSYVPEELMISAGLQPYRIPNIGAKPSALIPSFVCPSASNTLENILEFEDLFSGFVVAHTCDPMWRLYDILKKKTSKPVFFLRVPHNTGNALSLGFFKMELSRFRTFLETHFDTKIDDSELSDSIETCNESRDLLRNSYMLNNGGQYKSSGFDRLALVLACMWMPKSEFNTKAKRLSPANDESHSGLRLHLTGTAVFDLDIIKMMEESGGFVASDDLCTGSRYFWANVENTGDPILALSERYLKRIPCPSQNPLAERLEHIRYLVNKFKVQGVVTLATRFCDPILYDSVHIGNMLAKDEIPTIVIEYEDSTQEMGRIKSRIEAFIESIGD
jgi:benzoyl-CoA reductase subunit C